MWAVSASTKIPLFSVEKWAEMQKYKAKPAFKKRILHQFSASVYVFLLESGVMDLEERSGCFQAL